MSFMNEGEESWMSSESSTMEDKQLPKFARSRKNEHNYSTQVK